MRTKLLKKLRREANEEYRIRFELGFYHVEHVLTSIISCEIGEHPYKNLCDAVKVCREAKFKYIKGRMSALRIKRSSERDKKKTIAANKQAMI